MLTPVNLLCHTLCIFFIKTSKIFVLAARAASSSVLFKGESEPLISHRVSDIQAGLFIWHVLVIGVFCCHVIRLISSWTDNFIWKIIGKMFLVCVNISSSKKWVPLVGNDSPSYTFISVLHFSSVGVMWLLVIWPLLAASLQFVDIKPNTQER